MDLYGEPMVMFYPKSKERITDALTWDTRINSVSNNFEQQVENKLILQICGTHDPWGH